jgi:predicted nuclease of restriction endonuclease-like (RecB) superfamily
MEIINNSDYRNWFVELKRTIQKSQLKAALSVNSELILMYWNLGVEIIEKQQLARWGSGFLITLSKDLQREFPDISGFSKRNLELIRQWVHFYKADSLLIAKQLVSQLDEPEDENMKQVVSQFNSTDNKIVNGFCKIPWGHHILIVQKIRDLNEAIFYIGKTVENNWSRSVLEYQIESNLYNRQGKAVTNFKSALPAIQSDLANALLKDPYNFEFITLAEQAKEKELELKLIQHISQFLLELGMGFAYMGRQFLLKVGSKEYRTDLLFYHTRLKCYIIIELKHVEFEPEFVGKLNFYISAIDDLVKDAADNATIGILLCKNKDNYEVEFALRDIHKPIGVSEYRYKELPENIKQSLPTLEELTNELRRFGKEQE